MNPTESRAPGEAMRFDFFLPTQIFFGAGSAGRFASTLSDWGRRILVVTGGDERRIASLVEPLAAGHQVERLVSRGEPTIESVREGVQVARRFGCEGVVAIGGGSVIDAGKAVAGLVTNSGEPLDYLEIIGRGQPLTAAPLPFAAVPTTAGTGAEATRNAVIGSPSKRVKASLRSTLLFPRVAVVDPDLTLSLPPVVTAHTGLDALTQLIEPFVSRHANAMTDCLCRDGFTKAARYLRQAYCEGTDRPAREALSYAALLSGIALTNAGLGVVHGFAGPLGAMLGAPHGALCAAVLPFGIAANIEALRSRAPHHPALGRYAALAEIATGDSSPVPEQLADWCLELCQDLGVRPLEAFGFTSGQMEELVEKAAKASSMKTNPIELTADELRAIAARAMVGR